MSEKRRERRVREQALFTITLLSKDTAETHPKVIHHTTEDISLTGAKIHTNAFLPVGSFLKIDLSLTEPPQMISAYAKVRWVKSVYADESFELGIEFVDTSISIIRSLKEHFDKTAREKSSDE
ncbi:MAG: hypothetical protein GTO16_10465 [Candidatus Aminicenantes bacterium]|nr:hypothetical protein [Candidatus Aminicenantes bacterium]